MEVARTKPKLQSVSDIWQTLKNQFVVTRKHVPKSQTNWNAFSRKTESSSDSILTSFDANNYGGGACDTQPFILGIPRHHSNTAKLDGHHNGLRTTAKAILRRLEKEKQARSILENMEKEKSPELAMQVAVAAATTFEDARLSGTSYKEVVERPSKIPAVGNSNDEMILSRNGEEDSCLMLADSCAERSRSELQEEGIADVGRSLVPTQSNLVHVIKVNSTFTQLRNSRSEEKCDIVNDLNHENPKDSVTASSNGLEEERHTAFDDSESTSESAMQVITANGEQTVLTNHQASCSGSNFSSAFSTFDVYSSYMQDEAPTSATDEELIKIINKDVNCLHDPAIDVRYEALHSLHRALLGDFVGEVNYLSKRTTAQKEGPAYLDVVNTGLFESPNKFARVVEKVVVKPLLKSFSDSSERCRYLSVYILIALLHSVPWSVITLLPYIIPVISSRFSIKFLPTEDPSTKVEVIIVEKSEDIRLLLIYLIQELLKTSKAMIHPFASDTATILTAAACDCNPEVLMETFAAMTLFGEICGTKLKPVAKQLISVVIPSLSHNRHRVRVVGLHAIHRLVLCGAHESIYDLTAFRDPNTVPIRAFYHPDPKTQYLALLAGDRSIQVREQLLRTVASWLQELDERKEHECRLVPYLLSGFSDESPTIQHLAFQLMQEVGHLYEAENENEVKDTQIYLPEDIDDLPAVAGRPLPSAFTSRPCLGARILVRSCCSVMLHALSGDLDAWTSGTKSLAADFLETMLLFVEEHITMHLQQVIIMLMKALKDPLTEAKVSNSANVLGHFVDPTAYLLIILPRITGELYNDSSVQQLAQAVKLLAKVMQGSPASRLTIHIPEICSVLTESDIMKSIQLDMSQSIVAVAKEMVRAWTVQVKEETISILWILLNAAAAANFCGRPALEAESTLQTLATTCGNLSADALISTYGETILELLPHPQFWAMRSLDVLVFCKVVQVAPLILPGIIDRIFLKIAWFGRGSLDPDPKLWLLRAIQKMVKMSGAATSVEHEETISSIRENMVELLENFLVPCLEQVREGLTALRAPTLDTISEIISNSSWSVVLPSSLARGLCDLERFEHKQEAISKEEKDCAFSTPSRETLLEILQRLRKPICQ